MRRVAHGVVWFQPDDEKTIKELMKSQCSAMRAAYQAIHKRDLEGNDVVKHVKVNYMEDLNQRYVADACLSASMINQEHAIFGGKRDWKRLQTGAISKEEWRENRNNQLYSRGDRSAKNGNPNIRIRGDKLQINDPTQRGKWIDGNLHIPSKFQVDLSCYDVRVIHRNNQFEVIISWEEKVTSTEPDTRNGVIGLDINPDGVALVETNEHGNLLGHQYILKQRTQFASENKRDYDVHMLANQVVEVAKKVGKPIILEKLNFKQGKGGYKKFRRMKSNFLYRKISEAIISRCVKEEVPFIEVNPAFTSILGNLKFLKMYSLNRHTAAALVIARRGMGIKEGCKFTVTSKGIKGEKFNLEGRGFSQTLTLKAYSWLSNSFIRQTKPTDLTGPGLAAALHAATDSSVGEIPTGEPSVTTDHRGMPVPGSREMEDSLEAILDAL